MRSLKSRKLYNRAHARANGNHTDNQDRMVYIGTSTIPGMPAGRNRGVFSNKYYKKGDCITAYDGETVDMSSLPIEFDHSYTVRLKKPKKQKEQEKQEKVLIGICEPEYGKGVGTFINRAERKLKKGYYKNCEMRQSNGHVYIYALCRIFPGMELFMSYGQGYIIKK